MAYNFLALASTNHSKNNREEHDFYATEPRAVEELVKYVKLQKR